MSDLSSIGRFYMEMLAVIPSTCLSYQFMFHLSSFIVLLIQMNLLYVFIKKTHGERTLKKIIAYYNFDIAI